MDKIYDQAKEVFEGIKEQIDMKMGSLLVVGCSTSTVLGNMPGTSSSEDVADQIYKALIETFGDSLR